MQSKFTPTPGPWRRDRFRVVDAHGYLIADCGSNVPRHPDEQYANARVMAEAPAMREEHAEQAYRMTKWMNELRQAYDSGALHYSVAERVADIIDGLAISIDKAETLLARIDGQEV
jgi:hypothetical protein